MDGAPNFMTNHAAPCARIKKHDGFAIQKINVTTSTNISLHTITIPTHLRTPNKHYLTQVLANGVYNAYNTYVVAHVTHLLE